MKTRPPSNENKSHIYPLVIGGIYMVGATVICATSISNRDLAFIAVGLTWGAFGSGWLCR